MDLSSLHRECREQLLDSTKITLVVTYSGTAAHHKPQLDAAENVVARDRHRQLSDQAKVAGQVDSKVQIEIPAQALMAAAPGLCTDLKPNPNENYMRDNAYFLDIDSGPILPGYLMEVLDWYCRALNAKQWYDFLPADPSVQDCDKFYWLYIYITMRKLRMHVFANTLGGPFIGILVEQHQLADDVSKLEFIIQHLPEGDPLLNVVAGRYVQLEQAGRSPLLPEQWCAIQQAYSHFGSIVWNLQGFRDLFSDMERLGINDGVGEDMED
ncbi:hypothetical protein SLS60_007157 [Paraconiothyrium brasiliense]|uniref:Uncharacterized protein n=1 Tax=Paraconiothyrium brasiliense TaxID=300254 RepID=A0ABR3R8K6_9PLEO